ncbi:hypothetical protein B0T26DRAFT_873782 [Lasiosphaeria miniovina]|uniref:AA1-like domain-containing protein n=1 Tax=Lasiosphaeria miniovina TaxID=1954250 RepID=A0AA40ADB5_9PEZI|nr:uncharacterized protein B0T26DRAFT_873782 [Lasiosphaeria miniovina]KAK0713710.1 hypothetical protein B0T26DRAFT_873782 [Lasiosphaeria miniovina]
MMRPPTAPMLTLPFLLAVYLASAQQVPNSTSGCAEESAAQPSWNIADWTADFSDVENTGGSVIFELRNNAANYTTLCFQRGALSQCFWVAGTDSDAAETYFAFNPATYRLGINQTWACPGAAAAAAAAANGSDPTR